MQFALVNEDRCPPTPNVIGKCIGCGEEMIAKCGEIKIWHWSHKGKRKCDPWWEPETAWHREWKERFPAGWREVIQWSAAGEKHIADVRNASGLVIEFQHSAISAQERTAREAFYEDLIWVVDGTRLKYDISRFDRGSHGLRAAGRPDYFMTHWPSDCFPKSWIGCSKPVFFDFGGHDEDPDTRSLKAARGNLWCLLPGRVDGQAVIAKIERSEFLDAAHRVAQSFPPHSILLEIAQAIAEHREAERRVEAQYLQRLRFQNSGRGRLRFFSK